MSLFALQMCLPCCSPSRTGSNRRDVSFGWRLSGLCTPSRLDRWLTPPRRQSILICVFGSLLGGSVSGFCASLGAPTGLRQISISRYSFGWWPTKLVAVLNTIQQVGWSSAGCITGGIALNAVADGKVSTTVGIVIIAVCSLIVSFFGIKAILPF